MIDIDISLVLLIMGGESIGGYSYIGSVVKNTKEEYDTIIWLDQREKPKWEQIEIAWKSIKIEIQKQNCKNKAKDLIANCDWSVLPDVKLQNKSDFENYRSQLRELIINPVENPIFSNEPNPIWST